MTDKKRLLIVEEKGSAREEYQTLLQNYFEIKTASNGETGLSLFSNDKPEVVILSSGLHGTNVSLQGKDLLGIMKSQAPQTVVVIVSASRENERDFVRAGADGFLKKPWSKSELLRILSEKGLITLK